MKIVATEKSEQNRVAIDPWTAVHAAAGLACGLVDAPRRWSLGVALGYELAEQVFERQEWGRTFFKTSGPEVVPNAIVDMVVFVVGYELGQAWNRTGRRR